MFGMDVAAKMDFEPDGSPAYPEEGAKNMAKYLSYANGG